MSASRLFHVSGNQYPPLPATHHTRRIWDELAKGFDEYHVIARSEGMNFSHTVDGNIHLHLMPAFGRRMWVFFFLSWLLPWYVLRYRPTHLLVQCPVVGGLAAALCASALRLPLFVELHGAHYFGRTRPNAVASLEFHVYRVLSKITFRVADKIRSLSDDMSDNIRRVYGGKTAAKTVVIPTRVDLSVFHETKQDYTLGAPVRIITIGAYAPNKNHCQLIRDLHASGIAFTLTLVGSGPLAADYAALARQLGIADAVIVTGPLSHEALSSLLARHDIYVHYSLSEGLSRAILEAMALGLPVIATRVGFIRGVLIDDVNALVLDQPWSGALAGALGRLVDSHDQRQQVGQAARRTIVERFESGVVFENYRNAILHAHAVPA